MSDHADRRGQGQVGRRWFIRAFGGTAAALGLAACADDGPIGSPGQPVGTGSAPAATTGSATDANVVATAPGDGGAAAAPAGVASTPDGEIDLFPPLTRLADLEPASADEIHLTYPPNVPPPITRSEQRIVDIDLEVVESTCSIDTASGVKVPAWGFRVTGDDAIDCGTPGPVIRARVGDLVRITLRNPPDSGDPHNIEFHALTGPGGGAPALTVAPGESASVNGRLLCPGVFMYHCAAGDVPMHVAYGMFGMFIVDPEQPMPHVDHEWAVLRSEWYVGRPDADGFAAFDPEALLLEHPRYVTLNGRVDALTGDAALRMAVGERARFFLVNGGLNLGSSLQASGAHWATIYPDGATHPLNRPTYGAQAVSLFAGEGAVAELIGHVPGSVTLLDHALVRPFAKGGVGTLVIDGDDNGLFSIGEDGLAAAVAQEGDAPPAESAADAVVVVIPVDAWMPDNAANAFSPNALTIPVGTTVRWENADQMPHTVTSGSSDGALGVADGRWDSGVVETGATFEFTFGDPGVYDYFCQPHPWMIGTVTVTA